MDKKLQPGDIYAAALAELTPGDIDHHASDLYLRKTPASTALVNRLTTKVLLSTFESCDGSVWYDLPFCFTPFWEDPAKYH